MRIKDIKILLSTAGIEESAKEAELLVEHFLGLDNKKLAINPNFEPSQELLGAIKKRCDTKAPVQHIIGQSYFMGEYFYVNENVLIPRDETELLVRKAIEIINKHGYKKVLDVGTGTGCIACIIAQRTKAQVLGVDISSKALSIALDNSSKLKLYNKAIFRKSDLFSNIHEDEEFDVIISNPPYIPITERESIQNEVKFDPEIALYAHDKNGVEFYEKIASQATKYIKKDGYIIFELGIGQSTLVKEILEENKFYDIEIIKDLAYIDRVIIGRKR